MVVEIRILRIYFWSDNTNMLPVDTDDTSVQTITEKVESLSHSLVLLQLFKTQNMKTQVF